MRLPGDQLVGDPVIQATEAVWIDASPSAVWPWLLRMGQDRGSLYSEALANLIHPFWMLPILGILGLKARDIIGYTMLQFAVLVPLVLFLVWLLNYTLSPQ